MTGHMLVSFGFGWMVVGALIGLILGAKHENHNESLESAAACGSFAEYHRISEAYKWRSSVHAHSMLFSLSSVGVGLVLSSPAGGAVPNWIVAVLMFATVTWTLAATRRIRPLMGLADLLFAGSIATVAVCTAWNA